MVVEDAAEAGVQHRGTRLREPVEREQHALRVGVDGDSHAVRRAGRVDEPRLVDVELGGVQPDLVRGVGDIDLDRALA